MFFILYGWAHYILPLHKKITAHTIHDDAVVEGLIMSKNSNIALNVLLHA